MDKIVVDEVLETLLQTALPGILGTGRIYYRAAIRDSPLPYLCYNLHLTPVDGEQNFLMEGELIFDMWDYATVNDRTLQVTQILRDTFNDGLLQVEGATAVRFYYTGSREAPVENNRSNRRSEDEHIFRREISFAVRGYDLQAQRNQPVIPFGTDFFAGISPAGQMRVAAPIPQPDGIESEFTLPSDASQILYYTLDGVSYEDHGREGMNKIILPSAPAAGVSLTVGYIPL